jgi:hypothetical protein
MLDGGLVFVSPFVVDQRLLREFWKAIRDLSSHDAGGFSIPDLGNAGSRSGTAFWPSRPIAVAFAHFANADSVRKASTATSRRGWSGQYQRVDESDEQDTHRGSWEVRPTEQIPMIQFRKGERKEDYRRRPA